MAYVKKYKPDPRCFKDEQDMKWYIKDLHAIVVRGHDIFKAHVLAADTSKKGELVVDIRGHIFVFINAYHYNKFIDQRLALLAGEQPTNEE